MLYLLSPAKRLDFDTPVTADVAARATQPQFLPRSAELIAVLKRKPAADIAALMDLSAPLAQLNADRYRAWKKQVAPENSKPALLAFNGDVYGGLEPYTLTTDDLDWAQSHLLILSGLYGVLRPLDLMQPYRLEMGTRLATKDAESLYAFWGDRIARHLNARLAGEPAPVIVNLASQEYFKAADRRALKPRVVECVFEDWKTDRYKIISFFAKRARGLMARHAIEHRITQPEQLTGFAAEGYAFDPAVSMPDRLVFRRRIETDESVDDHADD
jgi:cytoplasmic iron level regulating protein YaaA (DUF328/UPF0246 family)